MVRVSRRIRMDTSSHDCVVLLSIGKDSRGITKDSVTYYY